MTVLHIRSRSVPHIRWMIRRDMPSVLKIESESFEFPWTEEDFLRCLRQRNCIGMVAVTPDDEPVGFMLYELHKNRLQILNFAVGREHRKQGIGQAMVERLHVKLSPERRASLCVEVREANLAGHLFFKRCGFRATDIVHDRYEDSDEAAYVFRRWYWDVLPEVEEAVFGAEAKQ